MRFTTTPDPKKFPDPDTWATWIRHRTPQFKTHKTLGIAKTACVGRMNGAKATCDMYVYEWDDDARLWVERHFIAKDTEKADAPLFQQVVPRTRTVKPPSDRAMSAAIDSILSATTD